MLPYISILNFQLEAYPLFFGLAVGLLLFNVFQNTSLKEKLWVLSIVIISFLSARLLFLLVSSDQIDSFSAGGGLVILGAIIPGLIWVKLSSVIFKMNRDKFCYCFPLVALAHAIGRIGCFLAGCCFGIEIGGYHLPVQLLESLFLLFIYIKLKNYTNRDFIFIKDKYLLYYASFRFPLEFLRDDSIRGIFYGLSTSQWLCLSIFTYLIIKKLNLKYNQSLFLDY
jgi:phosphatidylglycerol:prolipoprotein diacylglycerol transferase